MKTKLTILFIILFLTCAVKNLFSQDKVRIRVKTPPLNNLTLNHMYACDVENLTNENLKIRLEGIMKEAEDGEIVKSKSGSFALGPKEKKSFNTSNVPGGGEYSWKNNKYKEILLRTGRAPSGSYTICVSAIDEGGNVVGQENCVDTEVKDEGVITLISPEDGSDVNPGQPIIFSWTPLPGAKDYTLRIVEIKGDQSPEVAMKTNKPVWEKSGITTTTTQVPSVLPWEDYGGDDDYLAWTVISGNVESEVWRFNSRKRNEKIYETEKADSTPNKWQRLITSGFIENKGQFNRAAGDEAVEEEYAPLLVADISIGRFMLTKRGFSYIIFRAEEIAGEEHSNADSHSVPDKETGKKIRYNRIDYSFENINIIKTNVKYEEPDDQGAANYYYESCPDGILNVSTYKKITITDVYRNIDLVLYGNDTNGIKYEFIVKPGGNPSEIKFKIQGAKNVQLTGNNQTLKIENELSAIEDGPLNIFYEDNLAKIPAEFATSGKENYFLNLTKYDRSKTIVIDPAVSINWSTLYGGSGFDGPKSVKTDNMGNIFVCGYSGSVNFPVFNPGNSAYFDGTINNSGAMLDAVIIKFDNSGKRLWSTYFGGNATDKANDLCVYNDAIFIVGNTFSTNFPLKNNGGYFKTTAAINRNNGFLAKFDNNGVLIWSTYYGGSSATVCNTIDINSSGIFFVGGYTNSNNFEIMTDNTYAYQQSLAGGSDAFILAFDENCVRKWSTCFGGANIDECNSLAVDDLGNIFITGKTSSSNIPVFNYGISYNQPFTAATDAFISGFNSAGNMFWSTYCGGFRGDVGKSICTDNSGNVILAGNTNSNNFPVFNCTEGQTFLNEDDIFIMKFTNQGNLIWGRFLGGGNDDNINDVVCKNNNIWLTGQTFSTDFVTKNPSDGSMFLGSKNGNTDAILSKLDENGLLKYSTFFGSNNRINNSDWGSSLCFNNNSELIITGEFGGDIPGLLRNPGSGAYFQSYHAGNDDGFIMKFGALEDPPSPPIYVTECRSCPEGLQSDANIIANSKFTNNEYNDADPSGEPNWTAEGPGSDGNAGRFCKTGLFTDNYPGINGNKFGIRNNASGLVPGVIWTGSGIDGPSDNFFIYQYTAPLTGAAFPKIIWQQKGISISPNTTYTLCFYVKKLNPDPMVQNPKIKVRLSQVGGSWEKTLIPTWSEISWTDWKIISTSWVSPSSISSVNLEIWGAPVSGNINPCPVGIGLDDVSFSKCIVPVSNSNCANKVIGTDITVYPGLPIKLNTYLCISSPNTSIGAVGTIDLPLPPAGSGAIINPAGTVLSNIYSGLDASKKYLVFSFENGRLMTDGNQWGRLFDSKFFINRNQGPTSYGSYSVECINNINPLLSLSNGSYPTLTAPLDIDGNEVFNYAWNSYYFTFTGSTTLVCKNLFSPIKSWTYTENGSINTINSISLGNINQSNVMRYHIFELCSINDYTGFTFEWLPQGHSVALANVVDPEFPSTASPGLYNYVLRVITPGGLTLTDNVSVKVEPIYFNICN